MFNECDPSTWTDLPDGYEWRKVSDIEMHLFSPDGRNLSETYWRSSWIYDNREFMNTFDDGWTYD